MSGQRHFCCDDETGEITTYLVNDETGEPTPCSASSLEPRATTPPTPTANAIKFLKAYMCVTKKFQALKENIIRDFSEVYISPRLLLIPVFIMYPLVMIIVVMFIEVFLHVCCHKHNRSLREPSLHCQSPLHVLSSIICGVCRDSEMSSQVGQLQNQQRSHYG